MEPSLRQRMRIALLVDGKLHVDTGFGKNSSSSSSLVNGRLDPLRWTTVRSPQRRSDQRIPGNLATYDSQLLKMKHNKREAQNHYPQTRAITRRKEPTACSAPPSSCTATFTSRASKEPASALRSLLIALVRSSARLPLDSADEKLVTLMGEIVRRGLWTALAALHHGPLSGL